MTDKVSIDRALLQDLIDDVSDYAASREFRERETKWRTELLEKSRALLAAGASDGQAEPVAWFDNRPEGSDKVHWGQTKPFFTGEWEPLYTDPSAEIAALRERIAGMEKDAERYRSVRALIADDAYAMSFQTMGQYRTALLKAIAKE